MNRFPASRPQSPLRVAVIASSLKLAGAEKQTAFMARALLDAETDARFFLIGQTGPYESVIRGMGMPFISVSKPNRLLATLVRLTRALCRFRPQVVLVSQFGDLLHGGMAGRVCDALVLGGVRSDGFYELNTHGWKSPWMLRLAHGLVANSHRARANLVSQGTRPQKIRVLPNVIDLNEFDTRSQLPPPCSIPADRVIAAAVGSLQPCKRFDRFVEALAKARRQAPALLGVIAGGDRGCRPALEQRAQALGLAPDHLLFLGECDRVPALLARAACLVLCSDYEGFPNVILEAMSAGLPVVTTPAGDAARIVADGRTGYVVDGDDLEAQAERLARLALAPELRKQLGTEARRIVAREYSHESLPGRLLSVFHEFAVQTRHRYLSGVLREGSGSRQLLHVAERPLFGQPLS